MRARLMLHLGCRRVGGGVAGGVEGPGTSWAGAGLATSAWGYKATREVALAGWEEPVGLTSGVWGCLKSLGRVIVTGGIGKIVVNDGVVGGAAVDVVSGYESGIVGLLLESCWVLAVMAFDVRAL